MIRKLASGQFRLYSRKKDPKTGKRRNLGTFDSKEAAQNHEREVQYFKRLRPTLSSARTARSGRWAEGGEWSRATTRTESR